MILDRCEYAEMHTLEWDIINSAWGYCVYRQQDNCQHYTGNCPQEERT